MPEKPPPRRYVVGASIFSVEYDQDADRDEQWYLVWTDIKSREILRRYRTLDEAVAELPLVAEEYAKRLKELGL